MKIPILEQKLILRLSRYYCVSGVIETLGMIIFMLSIPSDPKNAFLLGFSKTRLLMAGSLGVILLVFLGTMLATWADHDRQKKRNIWIRSKLTRYGKSLPGMILIYCLVLGSGYLLFFSYLLNNHLTTRAGVLLRLSPFVILAFTRSVQLAVVFFILINKAPKRNGIQQEGGFIHVQPQKIFFILTSTALLLILISLMADLMEFYTWNLTMLGFRMKIDINREANIPTFFSTLLILIATLLLWVTGDLERYNKQPFGVHWTVLSIIFLILALDEASGLHERIEDLVKRLYTFSGLLHYAWVVPAIFFIFILGVIYLRFFLALPRHIQRMLLLAICTFILGAVGIEMLNGWYRDKIGMTMLIETILTTTEETLEMLGMILFIRTLMIYLRERYTEIKFFVFIPSPEMDRLDQD